MRKRDVERVLVNQAVEEYRRWTLYRDSVEAEIGSEEHRERVLADVFAETNGAIKAIRRLARDLDVKIPDNRTIKTRAEASA